MSQPISNNPVDLANAKRESSIPDARAQAAEFDGFAADEVYTTPTGKKFPVCNVSLLDDDQQERFDALNFSLSKCDKNPDVEIPGRTVVEREKTAEGDLLTETETVYPAQVVKGGYVQPYQRDGELVTPNYNIQLVRALLGDDGYAEFKAAKGKSSEYSAAVKKLSEKLTDREAGDPKSEAGPSALADVSD